MKTFEKPGHLLGRNSCSVELEGLSFHRELFGALDKVEGILSKSRYLTGNRLTEADVRLFMTLIRFDEIYFVYFKTNKKRIADYPNISGYVKDLYQTPGDALSLSYLTYNVCTGMA